MEEGKLGRFGRRVRRNRDASARFGRAGVAICYRWRHPRAADQLLAQGAEPPPLPCLGREPCLAPFRSPGMALALSPLVSALVRLSNNTAPRVVGSHSPAVQAHTLRPSRQRSRHLSYLRTIQKALGPGAQYLPVKSAPCRYPVGPVRSRLPVFRCRSMNDGRTVFGYCDGTYGVGTPDFCQQGVRALTLVEFDLSELDEVRHGRAA